MEVIPGLSQVCCHGYGMAVSFCLCKKANILDKPLTGVLFHHRSWASPVERNPLSQHPTLLWSLLPTSLVQKDYLLLLYPHSQPPPCMSPSIFCAYVLSSTQKMNIFFNLQIFIALQLKIIHMVVGLFFNHPILALIPRAIGLSLSSSWYILETITKIIM